MKQFFRNPFTELLLVIFVAVLATIIFTYPSITQVSSAFIGDGGDNYEHAGYQGLSAKRITEGKFPFSHTSFWRYPVGFDFARGFDSRLSVGTGTILSLLIDLPLAYNMLIFIMLVLNGLFSYLCFRGLTQSRLLGIVGMVMYGFSFYALAKAFSHPNLLFIGGVPFFVFVSYRLWKKAALTGFDFALLLASLVLLVLGSAQYLLIFSIFAIFYGFLLFRTFPNFRIETMQKAKAYRKQLIVIFLAIIVATVMIYYPQIKAAITGNFMVVQREHILYTLTPSLTDFFLPNGYLKLLTTNIARSTSLPSIEKVVFFGWVELLLFVLFFFTNINKRIKFFLGISFTIPFLLALGYGKDNSFMLLPYRFLGTLYPFTLIAEPGRYAIVYQFFVTVAALLTLQSIRNEKKRLFFILVVLVLIVIERLPSGTYLVESFKNEPFVSVVAKEQSKAVLDIPINITSEYARYDVLSLLYNKPIVNGYFHWSADTDKAKRFITKDNLLNRYICRENDFVRTDGSFYAQEEIKDQRMLALLKENGIKTIVVHKYDKFFHPVCKNVRQRLSRLHPSIFTLSDAKDKQQQLNGKAWDGKPSFSLYFPKDGEFFLDGVFIAPNTPAAFHITYNGAPAEFSYSWSIHENRKAMELFPKNTIAMHVQAGSILTFKTFADVDNTWFSLWYRYKPDEDSVTTPYQTSLKKIFEDDEAVVYRIQ